MNSWTLVSDGVMGCLHPEDGSVHIVVYNVIVRRKYMKLA
jgi:hypothetical protein